MYEFALKEWHLDPAFINNNWSEELFALMLEKAMKRYTRSNEDHEEDKMPTKRVTPEKLLATMGVKVEKVGPKRR